ncbi:MAG: hypothetical protein IPK87_12360 [Planctomycetes bacterium]|nr:hypothetical protein [Planctomycetota bacterium]
MDWTPQEILAVLDKCCESFTFPMLDNGYVYLAATRLSLFRSPLDWAMVIEVFGFSPRAGLPDTSIQTFASQLHARDKPEDYVDREAHQNYLKNNPHNEFRSAFPLTEGDWQDSDDSELLAIDARMVELRGQSVQIPGSVEYERHGITLEESPRVKVIEFCRYLAEKAREPLLATEHERRVSVLPQMHQILQLEDWHHPDVANDELPSRSETFRQLADVLVSGNASQYRPSIPPNTHWRNWPDGGRL